MDTMSRGGALHQRASDASRYKNTAGKGHTPWTEAGIARREHHEGQEQRSKDVKHRCRQIKNHHQSSYDQQ